MRKLVAILVAFLVGTGACAAQQQGAVPLTWGPTKALSRDDRVLADGEAKKITEDYGQAGDLSKAALLPLAPGGDLLLLQTPSAGNCGAFYLTIWGPRVASDRSQLYQNCQSDAVFRHTNAKDGMPDLVVGISDVVANQLHWDGSGWSTSDLIELESVTNPQGAFDFRTGDIRTFISSQNAPLSPLLRAPIVRHALTLGLGDRYLTFLLNLTVRDNTLPEGPCVTFFGLAPHAGGSEEALLAVCNQGILHAVLLTDGHLYLLSPERTIGNLPPSLQQFLQQHPGFERLRWVSMGSDNPLR